MNDDLNILSLPPDIEVVVAVGDQLLTARSGQGIPKDARFFGVRRIKAVVPADEIVQKKIDFSYGATLFHIGVAGLLFRIFSWYGVIAWGILTIVSIAIWNASVREANLRKYSAGSSRSGRAP